MPSSGVGASEGDGGGWDRRGEVRVWTRRISALCAWCLFLYLYTYLSVYTLGGAFRGPHERR